MSATTIASAFRAAAKFSVDDEVGLFRKLAKAIEGGTPSLFIDETHGAVKCNVEFSLTTGGVTRCEIADLLIISKSDFPPFYRATFWQAKKQSKAKWVALGTTDRHVDFRGQFNQWDLLSRRPVVAGVSPFSPPSDLLSSFRSGSVGSFGVFYERASQIELTYSIAEFISCANPKAKHSVMVANAYLENYVCYGQEVIVRTGLVMFLEALLGHHVGAPIDVSNAANAWILAYARNKVATAQGEYLDIFFDRADGDKVMDIPRSSDGLSLLLVDTRGST